MSYIRAPKPQQQPMYDFLEDLRQLGATNMFGAGQYLEAEFDLSKSEARDILGDWMKGHSDKSRILDKSETGKKAGRIVSMYESAEEL